jgi:hypothetical protein
VLLFISITLLIYLLKLSFLKQKFLKKQL